jgi:hypothetical protein
MEACSVLETKQIFTSYNNPKGNADTERVFRTIKEDFVWVREFSSPFEFAENFKEWIEYYNNDYPHSSLNYSTSSEYEKEHLLITDKFQPCLTGRSTLLLQLNQIKFKRDEFFYDLNDIFTFILIYIRKPEFTHSNPQQHFYL